jgi:hypothetical protein
MGSLSPSPWLNYVSSIRVHSYTKLWRHVLFTLNTHFIHSHLQSTVISLNCSSLFFYLLCGHIIYPSTDLKNIISAISLILYSCCSKFQFSQWYCHYLIQFQHCFLITCYKFHKVSLLLDLIPLNSIITLSI